MYIKIYKKIHKFKINHFFFFFAVEKDLTNLAAVKTEHQVQWQELSQFMQIQNGLCILHNSLLNCFYTHAIDTKNNNHHIL